MVNHDKVEFIMYNYLKKGNLLHEIDADISELDREIFKKSWLDVESHRQMRTN